MWIEKEVSVDFHKYIVFDMDDVREFFSAYSFDDETKKQQLEEILDSMDDSHDVKIYTNIEEDYVTVDVDLDKYDAEEILSNMSDKDKHNFLNKQLEYEYDFPSINNLADGEKFSILCQMFEKYSLEELQQKL